MSVTVMVPTVGRSAGLRRLLQALRHQDPGVDWRVLVVDNGVPPRAAELVAEETAGWAVPVRVVAEPRPGASHARNRGAAEVETDVVALLDDDVVPEPDWLARVLAPLADPSVAGVGGRVDLDPRRPRPRWLDGELAAYLTHLDLGPSRDLGPGDYLLTANAAFRTEVLRRFGFDPRLGPRPGTHLTNDDLDVARRMLAAGHRLVWAPDAVVVHDLPDERTRMSWLLARVVAQGRSDWLLEEERFRAARAMGLRVAVHDVVTAPRRWWGRAPTTAAYLAHLLADGAHAVGFAREALAALWQHHRTRSSLD